MVPSETRPPIIHIAESFAGGVSAAIRDYVRNTPEYEHGLVYAPRADAPLNAGDLEGFAFTAPLPTGHLARVSTIRRVVALHPGSIIHAHSSFGGFYSRIAIRRSRARKILYTPHCYAFERQDVSAAVRLGFKAIEGMLAFNTTVFVGCSIREQQLSRWPLAGARATFVPNVPPREIEPEELRVRDHGGPLVVAAGGRLGPQKDPCFFMETVRALRNAGVEIDPVWIGGGDSAVTASLVAEDIRVTGWLERLASLDVLRRADVYMHVARWEGFPLAILEAAELGVPTIVRRIPAFEGVDLPVFIDRPTDAASVWPAVATAAARADLVRKTRASLARYNDEIQARALHEAYAGEPAQLNREVPAA